MTLQPLPFNLGPYELMVAFAPRHEIPDRRRRSGIDLDRGVIIFDETLMKPVSKQASESAFDEVVKRLVLTSHYAHGLMSAGRGVSVDEEHMTHSLATGIAEFAKRNPATWAWMHRYLDNATPSRRFVSAALPAPRNPAKGTKESGESGDSAVESLECRFALPARLLVGEHVHQLKTLSKDYCDRARLYGEFDPSTRAISIGEGLRGHHRVVILLHEVLHALHREAGIGLRRRPTLACFLDIQAPMLSHLIRANPTFWRHVLAELSRPCSIAAGRGC